MRVFLIFTISLFSLDIAQAQEVLALQKAIELGLQNNYGIRIAQNDATIAENNVTAGNAGMLPSLTLQASQVNSINNTRQKFLSGDENVRDNANAETFTALAQLDWRLFDGLVMFTTHQQLKKLKEQGEVQSRLAIENTLNEIIATYYEITRLNQNITSSQENLALSDERLNLSKNKLSAGAVSKVDVLQAQVDKNNDESSLKQLQQQLVNTKAQLNRLMARAPETEFTNATDTIELAEKLEYSQLKTAMEQNNPNLRINKIDQELAVLQLEILNRRKWPVVDALVNYGYSNATSEAGFLQSNQNYGLTYGVGISLNLFNGFNLKRQQQNAQIMLESSQLAQENLTLELNTLLYSTHNDYESVLDLITLEQANLKAASENLELGYERHKQGIISGIDFREIQVNHILARNKLNNLIYQAKVTEAYLQRLAGNSNIYSQSQ